MLSKGHAAPVLYVALAYQGFFPAAWLKTLNADGTRLPSHADARCVPGIDMTTGSLGQGLSCACGAAYAARLDGKQHRVFCIIGDGESNEGQIWEAALFAAHHKLDNLVVITDYNKLQIDGFTSEVLNLEPLLDKWRAFGWEVFEMDGHDWDAIYDTRQRRRRRARQAGDDHRPHDQGQGLLRGGEQAREPQHQGARPGRPTTDSCSALSVQAALPY